MAKKTPTQPNLHALLIAIDCYLENTLPEGTYPSLSGCVRDVKHVEGWLRGTLEVPSDRIRMLTSTDVGKPEPPEPPKDRPTYENIIRGFTDLAERAEKGDQVYIHYSGHGGRSLTAYPALKGKEGLDESLVPLDIGDSEARYVRDLELAALLKKLTDKGLLVTLVLDCCHSGGATRAVLNNVAVRGDSFIDSTRRPAGDVEIPRELMASRKNRAGTRGLGLQSGYLLEPKGYTLLAACRPSESAYEFAFDGHERNGALTYWMLDALSILGPGATYKALYDRVLAKIHSQFEFQTPMLEGEADRIVFGIDSAPMQKDAIVLKVNDGGKSVSIGGGLATGLRKGAQLAVYPPGAIKPTSKAKPKGIVEIDILGATESSATVLPAGAGHKIEAGDRAILIGAGSSKLVRGVRLIRADGKPASKSDVALQAVAKAMTGNSWVELRTDKSAAEFLVTLNEAGTEYEICDRGGEPIANLNPPIAIKARNAPETIVDRLVHLAKYRSVQELDNFDLNSPLRGMLQAELVGFETDYDPSEKPNPKSFANGHRPPTLRVADTAFLKITNKYSQVLNIVVLDLDSNWSIAQAFPGRQNLYFEPLDPGRSLDLIPLTATLTPGYARGTDVIKVFATLGTPNFRVLELPALGEPIVPQEGRGQTRGADGTDDPLDSLLGEVAASRPKLRSLTAQSNPGSDWTMTQIEIGVERRK